MHDIAAYSKTEIYTRPNGAGGEHGATNVPNVADLPIVCAASFAGKPVPERGWVVLDMIPSGTVTLITGNGGVGKSLLVEQLGIAVAVGREWIGTLPERGPVVFVSAEDDLDELHRRVVAIANAQGIDIARLTDLHFVPLAGSDAVMGAPDNKSGIIRETEIWRGLVGIVEKFKPKLVILDTLADIFAGNEIARQEARQFVGILRGLAIKYDLAVVLLAHPSLSGMASGSGTSGSTAWSNSVRSRLYLETIKGDDGREIDADFRVLRTKKANYGPTGSEIRLRWSKGCFVRETPAGGFDKLAATAHADRVFLALLKAFNAQDRAVSASPSSVYAPTLFASHPHSEGMTKRALADAMNRLLVAKSISVETSGTPSKRRQRLVISSPRAVSEKDDL